MSSTVKALEAAKSAILAGPQHRRWPSQVGCMADCPACATLALIDAELARAAGAGEPDEPGIERLTCFNCAGKGYVKMRITITPKAEPQPPEPAVAGLEPAAHAGQAGPDDHCPDCDHEHIPGGRCTWASMTGDEACLCHFDWRPQPEPPEREALRALVESITGPDEEGYNLDEDALEAARLLLARMGA